MTLEALERLNALTLKFFQTPASKRNAAFTGEEIAILKQAGIMRRIGRRMSNEDAESMGRAYTTLSR